MPQESQLAHRVLTNLALPYITNVSPSNTDPHFISGSSDILTSINGYAERRPGFSLNVEPTPTTFVNLQRLFPWDDFSGNFYVMACDIDVTGKALVYKLQVGIDSSFVLIYSDATATMTPYDFVVSNNTLYFSNGTYAEKWSPVNGVSRWGISAAGAAANSTGPNAAVDGSQAGPGAPWADPSNVTSSVSFATLTLPAATESVLSVTMTNGGSNYAAGPPTVSFTGGGGTGAAGTANMYGFLNSVVASVTITDGGSGYTSAPAVGFTSSPGATAAGTANMTTSATYNVAQSLQGLNYSLGQPDNGTINGLSVSFQAIVTSTGSGTGELDCSIQLISNGNPIGTPKPVMLMVDGAAHEYSFGSPSDLWGASLNAQALNDPTFGFQITPQLTNIVGSYSLAFQVNNYQAAVSGIGGPTVSVSSASGTMSATVGYQYVECFGNSNTGHVSSPSPPSGSTGVFTSKAGVFVGITASADPQVNQIRIFRTTDSASGLGGQAYFEIPASPVMNSSATVVVTASSLTSNVATFTAANALTTAMYVTISGSTHDATFNVGPVAVASATPTQFTVAITHADITAAADAAAVLVSIFDSAADPNLNATSIAPIPTFNDPPTPMRGMVYFSGRIWGFIGNKVWFTGLEEITIGVPEESMPSGIAGNFWSFSEPVQGLAAAGIGPNQALVVLSGGVLTAIQGNTLDTFVRYQVSTRRGCRNLTCVSTLGGMVAWLDSANQVWAFDGANLNELSTLIRNDFGSLNQSACSLTFHSAGRFHWLVLSTGTKLYVYDIDEDQWMPPWSFAATYIYSGEISAGNYVLMASNGTKAIQLNPAGTAGSFNDNGSTYAPVAKFGLLSIVPDYGNRFSYIGVGSYNEPSRTGFPATFQLTNNGQPIGDFLICADEDPTQATYTTIAGNLADTSVAFNRANGVFMKQLVYQTLQPAARWVGIQVNLENADQVDNLYELFMAYKSLGGR